MCLPKSEFIFLFLILSNLQKLEEKYAMYEEREWGSRRQQDAGEFLLLLMGTLTETLITNEG